jgi:hypothetical protein
MSNVIEHPEITRTLKKGYPKPQVTEYTFKSLQDVCDVCDEYSADIKFKGTLLCSSCALEENIKIL